MRKKLLFLLACGLFAWAACSERESTPIEPENEGDVWLSLKIKTLQGTRGLIDGPENSIDNGTGDESNVETLKAILFDGFDDNAVVTNVTYVNVTGSSPTASAAFKVSRNAQSLLIIANPNEAFWPLIEVGVTTYGEINQAMEATVEDLIGLNRDKFMMTNASGRLEPWDWDPTLNPISIQDYTAASATQAEGAPFSMNLDRLVSKVRLYNDIAPGGTRAVGVMNVSGLEWGLNLTNKWFYPVSERMLTAIQEEVGYPTPPYTSYVHSDPYGLGTYRIDPNFDGPQGPGGAGVILNLDQHAQYFHFFNLNDPGNFEINFKPATIGSSGTGGLEDNVEYCLENTFDEPFSYHAWTTHVVIRANVYPQNVVVPDGSGVSTDGPGPNTSWLRISGVDYTRASLNARIQYELDNTGVTSPFVVAFDDFLQETTNLWVNLALPLQDVKDNFESVILDQLGTIGETIPRPMMWESAVYGPIAFYMNGISYYKIMIKHDNDDDPGFENRRGEFGVVRNSVYDIRVKSISGPGYPEIPAPDPETPNEISDMFMAIEIGMNPWTWYTQDEDL